MTKPITFNDIERMARSLVKDPATKRALESQFREIIEGNASDGPNKEELDKLYDEVKEKFEHGYSVDLGDNDGSKEEGN